MKNIKLYISKDVEEKALYKHGLELEELNNALEHGNPRIFKQGHGVYIIITHYARYITFIFKKDKEEASMITAYPSSDSQIRRYNKK